MKQRLLQLANWAVRNRDRLPRWMQRRMESVARQPDGWLGRLAGIALSGPPPPATQVPEAEIRIYIAPTNYAGQGFLWARALERSNPAIAARNLAVELPGGFAFPADSRVPIATVNHSLEWAETEWQSARQFTHVLIEAERSIFGRRFSRDIRAEIQALQGEGISVAMLCHGTDIRDPERHAELTPWSPYPEDPRTPTLLADARANHELLESLGLPVFVSTPDLLVDVPTATWCPVVVDGRAFATNAPLFETTQVRIMHASSNPVQKGSHHIEPALRALLARGEVEFALITGVSAEQMPAVFASTDIVLDQFRLGSYGTAACEAMAAGRIVIGHVLPHVRDRVEQEVGMSLPIVEATPDSLSEVVSHLIQHPDSARSLAATGPAYVAKMHSGEASARALINGWISPRN